MQASLVCSTLHQLRLMRVYGRRNRAVNPTLVDDDFSIAQA